MTLEIPYTFIPGTKAMANQVNENFLAVKNSFDENEDLLEEAQADILSLESNKADIQGSITTQFDVADATNNYNAVNLQTYKRLSANTIDIIQGYQLSKFDDHTIAIQPGSCYNSDRTKIITSTSGLQATQANLNPNGKYYVYITNDNDTIEGVISLSNSAPGGYTTYRQIGYFETVARNNTVAYIVSGSTPLSAGWLSATNGGQALTPELGKSYIVKTEGEYKDKIYNWDGTSYVELPDGSVKISSIHSYGLGSNNIVANYANGSSGYRIWADGYCEQWGKATHTTNEFEVTTIKEFADMDYIVLLSYPQHYTTKRGATSSYSITATNKFTVCGGYGTNEGVGVNTTLPVVWVAKGYLKEGEY